MNKFKRGDRAVVVSGPGNRWVGERGAICTVPGDVLNPEHSPDPSSTYSMTFDGRDGTFAGIPEEDLRHEPDRVMMDNERRADLGSAAVLRAALETNVARADGAQTAVSDVLAYIAHFCDRLGLDPEAMFAAALRSYHGDSEDGPPAAKTLDPDQPLAD